jgi:hypothetical protein
MKTSKKVTARNPWRSVKCVIPFPQSSDVTPANCVQSVCFDLASGLRVREVRNEVGQWLQLHCWQAWRVTHCS